MTAPLTVAPALPVTVATADAGGGGGSDPQSAGAFAGVLDGALGGSDASTATPDPASAGAPAAGAPVPPAPGLVPGRPGNPAAPAASADGGGCGGVDGSIDGAAADDGSTAAAPAPGRPGRLPRFGLRSVPVTAASAPGAADAAVLGLAAAVATSASTALAAGAALADTTLASTAAAGTASAGAAQPDGASAVTAATGPATGPAPLEALAVTPAAGTTTPAAGGTTPAARAAAPAGHSPDGPDAPAVTETPFGVSPSSGHQTRASAAGASDPSNAASPAATAPVGAAAPIHDPQPVAGTAAPTAAAPAAPGQLPTAQPALGAALARLRHRSDGTSELSIALHPAELGSVGVTATVRDGMLTVTVACADPAAHDAVTAALPTLRQDLAAAGFGSVEMTLRDSGAQPDPRSAPRQENAANGGPSDRDDQVDHRPLRPLSSVRSTTDRGLDRWL